LCASFTTHAEEVPKKQARAEQKRRQLGFKKKQVSKQLAQFAL
jgi:hypothetical protein